MDGEYMAEKGLLDVLQESLRLDYLSDLKFLHDYTWISNAIKSISADQYTLPVWNDAAEYLTGCTVDFDTAEEAKAYLENYKK